VHDYPCHPSKGKPVKIPVPGQGYGGNTNEVRDVGEGPGKSPLFSLTVYNLEIGLSGAKVQWRAERDTFVTSGASSTILEKRTERFILSPGRTHNRSRSPR
jgi:hypothetical protein